MTISPLIHSALHYAVIDGDRLFHIDVRRWIGEDRLPDSSRLLVPNCPLTIGRARAFEDEVLATPPKRGIKVVSVARSPERIDD